MVEKPDYMLYVQSRVLFAFYLDACFDGWDKSSFLSRESFIITVDNW